VILAIIRSMVMVYKSMIMGVNFYASELMERLRDLVNTYVKMVLYTRVNSNIQRKMGLEFVLFQMVQHTSVIGRMINTLSLASLNR